MANLTNIDLLKSDLNALKIKILTLGKEHDKAGRYDYYKEKLTIATELEEIIDRHFYNKSHDKMTNEEATNIAINGHKRK